MIDSFRNVMVIAAHPDDEVLGVGGTIPLMKQVGARVTVVIVTDGSSTQYPNQDEVARRKKEHLRQANEVLGTDEVIELDLPDMRLDTLEHWELNQALENVLSQKSYDTVFVHHPGDVNMDHQAIFQSLLVAVRPLPGSTVKNVLTYEVNSSTEWGARSRERVFLPNLYVDIAGTIKQKLESLDRYADELRPYPHPRSSLATESRARTRGNEVGYEYAEAFSLVMGLA